MLFRSGEQEVTLPDAAAGASPKEGLPQIKLEKPSVKNRTLEMFSNIFNFSARDAYTRTQEQIRINSEKLIKEEATEILQKTLAAIEYAISDEKYKTDVGGPGRPNASQFVLKKSYSEYRRDSKDYVCDHLRRMGYAVSEVEDVYLLVDWSLPIEEKTKAAAKQVSVPVVTKPATDKTNIIKK